VRRELPELAWTVTLLATGVVVGLIQTTHDLVPTTLALLALAAAGEALALGERWFGLRWPLAAAANLAIALVVGLSVREAGLPETYVPFSHTTALTLALLLAAVYVGGAATRTLFQRRRISVFAMLQLPLALVLGLGGAAWTAESAGVSPVLVGALALLLGALSYVVAAKFLVRGLPGARNLYFYSSLALALLLAGSSLLLDGGVLALAWLGAALLTAWIAGRVDRMTVAFQAGVYLVCGCGAAGSLRVAADAFVTPAGVAWVPVTPSAILGAAAAVGVHVLLTRADVERRWRLARASVGIVASFTVAGLAAQSLAPLVASDAGLVAALRTGVLGAASLLVARGGTWRLLRDLGFLVTPLLVVGGLKLAAEDLRVGRPLTLFLSLVLYGGALALAPRLQRRYRPPSSET
jgi:hypothetical protein